MTPTNAQLAAINTKNKTLLLSAAAGSGKTSTLTTRIIQSIIDKNDPKDIAKMLIVTFTRTSAADLKVKIYNAISDALAEDPTNKHLSNQLIKLGNAKISTIDSFYLNAVKQNFTELGLSSGFRICDSAEAKLIATDIMNEVIGDFYDNDVNFSSLCECFEKIRDTDTVSADVFIAMFDECMHTPDGVGYVLQCANTMTEDANVDFLDSHIGAVLRDYTISFFEGYLSAFEELLDTMSVDPLLVSSYFDELSTQRSLCIHALNILHGKVEGAGYHELSSLLSAHSFKSLIQYRGKDYKELAEYIKTLRNSFKKEMQSISSKYYCYSQKDFSAFYSLTAKNLTMIHSVLADFEERYDLEKKRRGIVEIRDLKRYALTLFANPDGTPTDLAKAYADQYTDIYIDEYQDVDPVQDLIFRCISRPDNRFMVGDIKQSIYGFRGAHSQLFSDYRREFPLHGTPEAQGSACETIFMSENFRCDENVIDFTNLVCAPLFRACGDSIGYTTSDDLAFSKKYEDPVPTEFAKVKVAVFIKNEKKALEAANVDPSTLPSPIQAEVQYIANSIKHLIDHGHKNDGTKICAGDIAVLFRYKTHAQLISDALTKLGIASSMADSSEYFQNSDVMMTLCILNTVDNPQRDVYLAGTLRSPIFNFDMNELLIISALGESSDSLYDKLCLCADMDTPLSKKCSDFKCLLEKWRSISSSMPVDKFLQHIYNSDAFVASGLVCEKNELGEGGNLQRLYDYARTFEAGSFKGLYNFIEYVNSLIENQETIPSSSGGKSADRVTLTTIHKSKGLEFPVCFVCYGATAFKTYGFSDDIAFTYGLGIAMSLSDSTGFASYVSPLKKILDLDAALKSVKEEMRVMYVALTRAREQLYVTANFPLNVPNSINAMADFNYRFNRKYNKLGANNYMEWILPTLKDPACTCAEMKMYTTDALPEFKTQDLKQNDSNNNNAVNEPLYQHLRSSFEFEYPYLSLQRIPSKLSVSKLSPDILDESDLSLSVFDTERKPSVPAFFLASSKKVTAAERGTATHLFLQFCNFADLFNKGTLPAINEIAEKRFIPRELADIIYTEDLEKMRESDFIRKIIGAKEDIREKRFNILLPAEEFTLDAKLKATAKGIKIAVQGVIDLILIDKDGNIELYDYKTDRLNKNELSDPSLAAKKMNELHGLQLSYYAKAVELLFNKAPSRIAVFSTHSARLYDVNVIPLKIPT